MYKLVDYSGRIRLEGTCYSQEGKKDEKTQAEVILQEPEQTTTQIIESLAQLEQMSNVSGGEMNRQVGSSVTASPKPIVPPETKTELEEEIQKEMEL